MPIAPSRRLRRLLLPAALIAAVPALVAVLSPPWLGAEVSQGLPRPAVVAHRGASWYAPEETVPAYALARTLGADYLEMDLQRTADGALVAFHDDTPARTTNAAQVFPGREAQTLDTYTLAELQQLDAGSWFNEAHPDRARPSFAGQKIATLADVLVQAELGGPGRDGQGPGVYIETKAASRFPGIEEDLVGALTDAGWLSQRGPGAVIFQSFEVPSLERLAALAPDVPRVLLVDPEMMAAHPYSYWIAEATRLGAGLGPAGYYAWPWQTGPAHRAGRVVHPYTINARWQMALLLWFGVDGMFTDRCDLLLRHLGRPAEDVPSALSTLGY